MPSYTVGVMLCAVSDIPGIAGRQMTESMWCSNGMFEVSSVPEWNTSPVLRTLGYTAGFDSHDKCLHPGSV